MTKFNSDGTDKNMSHVYGMIQGNRKHRAEGGPTRLGQDGHGIRKPLKPMPKFSGHEEMPHPVTRREMMESWNKAGKKPSPDTQAKIDKMPNYKKGGNVNRKDRDFGGAIKGAFDKFNKGQNGVLNFIPGVKDVLNRSTGGSAKMPMERRSKGGAIPEGDAEYRENHRKMKAQGKKPVYANGLSEQENGAFGKRAIDYKAKGGLTETKPFMRKKLMQAKMPNGEPRKGKFIGGLMKALPYAGMAAASAAPYLIDKMSGHKKGGKVTPMNNKCNQKERQPHSVGDWVKGAADKVKQTAESSVNALKHIKLNKGGRSCKRAMGGAAKVRNDQYNQ